MVILYHASPVSNLHVTGLIPGSDPQTSRWRMPHTYLGSLDYLLSDFFNYCKPGLYYLYSVDVSTTTLEEWDAPGEQWRTTEAIGAKQVNLCFTVDVQIRPRRLTFRSAK